MDMTDYQVMLSIAASAAEASADEGGIPIGSAIFTKGGKLVGLGWNRRVQHNDPSAHAEVEAFRAAGRRVDYEDLILVTTLAPCWYCSGLIRQFGFKTVIIGESRNFPGAVEWLRSAGIKVITMDSGMCAQLLGDWIQEHLSLWREDIGGRSCLE